MLRPKSCHVELPFQIALKLGENSAEVLVSVALKNDGLVASQHLYIITYHLLSIAEATCLQLFFDALEVGQLVFDLFDTIFQDVHSPGHHYVFHHRE